jgi:hypothetical protein
MKLKANAIRWFKVQTHKILLEFTLHPYFGNALTLGLLPYTRYIHSTPGLDLKYHSCPTTFESQKGALYQVFIFF